MDESLFQANLIEHGIELSEHQLAQFKLYYELLVEWNEKMNLTAITDQEEVYLKHFFDSLTASFHFDFSQPLTVCYVFSGSGFFFIILNIVYTHLQMTIVDSLKKRVTFLNHLADELNLTEIAFYHDRAENFGKNKKFRESFDAVLSRAVARSSVLSELCLPLVKVGGDLIMMKGANFQEEKKASEAAVEVLGGDWRNIHEFLLPIENSERNIAIIHKKRKTPAKYPRKAGLPNKEPIE